MPLLSAKFTLEVSSPCLLEVFDKTEPLLIGVKIDPFDVSIALIPATHWGTKHNDALLWTRGLDELQILVTRDEPEDPPLVFVRPDGIRDLTVQGMYLYEKLPEYKTVANEAANRVLRYFRDRLLTPNVKLFSSWTHSLSNPKWLDASGRELPGSGGMAVMQPVPGTQGEMGIRKLAATDLGDLQAFVASPVEASLELALFSGAQTAWFEGNLRRCVLELAICVEVTVKRRFFAASSPAGAAFDYLEDKAKVSVRILELIDSVASEAFAQSYKQQSRADFDRIDRLLRCRNKVAHRGELTYREDSGATVAVDAAHVESWWHSVAHLRKWIHSLR